MNSNPQGTLRRPLQRYLQDVVATQPDGRILLFWTRLNIVAGVLLMAMLWAHPFFPKAVPGHVLLFVGMPLVGLAWLMRTRPPLPAARPSRPSRGSGVDNGAGLHGRDAGLKADRVLQLVVGIFPWWALLASHLAQG